jgi:hypothetical protein
MSAVTVKVVGMTAGGREHIVAQVSEFDPVLLVPEPDNPYDRHAVAVYTAPRWLLTQRDELLSSLRAPDGIGTIGDDDRRLLMDRQAGYLPREFAARLDLPPQGVVGYVAAIRHAPVEYVTVRDGRGRRVDVAEPRVAGFDVTANLDVKAHA